MQKWTPDEAQESTLWNKLKTSRKMQFVHLWKKLPEVTSRLEVQASINKTFFILSKNFTNMILQRIFPY